MCLETIKISNIHLVNPVNPVNPVKKTYSLDEIKNKSDLLTTKNTKRHESFIKLLKNDSALIILPNS